MDARQARGEAIGAGVGAGIGAVFGMPGVGAKAGKFIGKFASKLMGKKGKEKIADKIEKEQSENIAYKDSQQTISARSEIAQNEMKEDAKYLQQIGVAKYGGKFNGMVYGKRHEEGGVMMYKDGSPIAEVEGDEYVINNDILKDKKESSIVMDRKKLQSYLDNENIQFFLYSILKFESGKVRGRVNTGGHNETSGNSSAFGSQQFIGDTRNGILQRYGIDAWSPDLEEQQLATLALLHRGKQLDNAAKGDYSNINDWEAFTEERRFRLNERPSNWLEEYNQQEQP